MHVKLYVDSLLSDIAGMVDFSTADYTHSRVTCREVHNKEYTGFETGSLPASVRKRTQVVSKVNTVPGKKGRNQAENGVQWLGTAIGLTETTQQARFKKLQ
jgi:hypothetical protein